LQEENLQRAISIAQTADTKTRLAKMKKALQTVTAESETEVAERRTALLSQMHTSFTLLAMGGAVALLLALMVGRSFSHTIAKRLSIILRNIGRVSEHRALESSLKGDDEFAQIDTAIHNLSSALKERTLENELFIYSI